jgi:hypothetical protein
MIQYIKELYYTYKNGITNLIYYFKFIYGIWHVDYEYFFDFMILFFTKLGKRIEKSNEENESKQNKVDDINYLISLINSYKNYDLSQYGYVYGEINFTETEDGKRYIIDSNLTEEEKEKNSLIVKEDNERKENQFKEIFNIIMYGKKSKGITSWWV